MGTSAVSIQHTPDLKIILSPPMELEKVKLRLPNMVIGFMLAVMALTAEGGLFIHKIPVGPAVTARLLISFSAWVYWMFCIFRIHRIMARATHGRYKVSPFGAIWPQFIPIYCWIWALQWPRRLAKFLNIAQPGLKMGIWWPGLTLLLGSVSGLFLYATCLHLFVMFGVGVYLNRKITQVVSFTQTVPFARKQQFSLAWTAGLGAGFGLVLCQAGKEFFKNNSPGEQLEELVVITLVSLGIIKFVEPLADWMRRALHSEEHHHEEHHYKEHGLPTADKHTPILRAVIFLALAFSSFSHELLDIHFKKDLWDGMRTLAAMLTISGGITYAWVAGTRRKRLKAGTLGLISGGGLALVLIMVLFLAFDSPVVNAESSQALQGSTPASQSVIVPGTNSFSTLFNKILAHHPIFAPWLIGSKVNSISTVAVNLLLWSILGLIGGLAIDKKWGDGSTRHVVLSVLAAALIVVFVLRFTQIADSEKISLGVAAVLGWCLSLLIYPNADAVLKTA
jgi:hypothetical protein